LITVLEALLTAKSIYAQACRVSTTQCPETYWLNKINYMLKKIILIGSLLLSATSAFAIEPFVITDVKVTGNGRLDDGTIFNYLPLKVGDEVDDEEARHSIKALFETGFFRNVKLLKEGTTLVVEVEERPSIAKITLVGAKDIKEEEINGILANAGLTDGRIYNQKRMNEVISALTDAYFARGRYSASIKEDIQILDQNRARITLNIDEGRVATIENIDIVGNEAFSDKRLKRSMELTSSRGFGFGRRDLYSKQKLEGDQEAIRSFYNDRGYFDFDIRSTNVTISPNKQKITIFINLFEGPLYQMGELSIEGGERLDLDKEDLLTKDKSRGLFSGKSVKGVFSRTTVSDIRAQISDRLADLGYGVAAVTPIPQVDKAAQVVDVVFQIDEGRRLYVRQVDIIGNTVTQDQVIRRELRQFEGARFSAADVRRSQERLQRLGHFEQVSIDSVPVPGVPDQVDLLVTVAERESTGSINFSVGYGEEDGVIFSVGYDQRNFLGTGKEVAIKVDNSAVVDIWDLRYTNPYYTVDGVSRTFFLNSTKIDSEEAGTVEYFSDTFELGISYKIPISEDNSVSFTLYGEDVQLENSEDTPPELQEFIDEHPENKGLGIRTSIAKDTLNDFIFPTSGSRALASLEAMVPGSDLEYYKINLLAGQYIQLARSGLSVKVLGRLGYGGDYQTDENLPFYKNYYAGGPSTVRGYSARSLGPQDTGLTPEPLGGNRRVLANAELLSPAFGGTNKKDKRLVAFFDAGMVYGPNEDIDLGTLRYSAGIALQGYNILGPLSLSYAFPLNDEEGDDLQEFQISLGKLFR